MSNRDEVKARISQGEGDREKETGRRRKGPARKW
jgi:hypothetical protein